MRAALPTPSTLHSEWIKIRSLRGTLGALAAVLAATAGIQLSRPRPSARQRPEVWETIPSRGPTTVSTSAR